MNLLEPIAHWPLAVCIGRALLHFLWQATLLSAALYALLALLRKRSPKLRYAAACAILAAMALCPIVTTLELQRRAPAASVQPASEQPLDAVTALAMQGHAALPPDARTSPEIAERIATAAPSGQAARQGLVASIPGQPAASASVSVDAAANGGHDFSLQSSFRPPVPSAAYGDHTITPGSSPAADLPIWAFLLWLAGVFVLSIRLIGGWMLVQRLLGKAARPVSGSPSAALAGLARRMGCRRAPRLLECADVLVPTMIGGLRSAILLPVGALAGLSTEMLEALLAHELAHLRRHDYVVNLSQSAIETVLFFHPAVWWVSGRIRIERELCCDDIVVSVLQDAPTYARALATLEGMRPRPLALAASDGELLARIRRILSRQAPERASSPSALLPIAVAVTLVFALVVSGTGYYSRAAARQRTTGAMGSAAAGRTSVSYGEPGGVWLAPMRHEAGPRVDAGVGARIAETPAHAAATGAERALLAPSWRLLSSGVPQTDLGQTFGALAASAQEIGRDLPRTVAVSRPPASELGSLSGMLVPGTPAMSAPPSARSLALAPAMRFAVPDAATRSAPDAPVIDKIVVIGCKVLSREAVLKLCGHKVGDPCTAEALTSMRDNLAKSGWFGMHHPTQPQQSVLVQSEAIGDGKCMVTITVDENDAITGIGISGSGPVPLEEVKALLTHTQVFNPAILLQDTRKIADLYAQRGYIMEFGNDLGIDPATPGTLVVPMIVSRVDEIGIEMNGNAGRAPSEAESRKQPGQSRPPMVEALLILQTKTGGYFNRKTFYELDRKALEGLFPGADVRMSHTSRKPGRLLLHIDIAKKGDLPPPVAPPAGGPATERGSPVPLRNTIAVISVIGNKVLNAGAILTISRHKVGDPCTAEVLASMRDNLVKTGLFGMHHPGQPNQSVRVQAEYLGNSRCKVAITVDENDPITGIALSGSGPIAIEEVWAKLNRTPVFNPQTFEEDKQRIVDLYHSQGYFIEFGPGTGMDPAAPGTLAVALLVTRVDEIEVKLDGAPAPQPERVLRLLKTQPGGYFNRNTFFGVDRKQLLADKRYSDFDLGMSPLSPGHVRLTINLQSKRKPKAGG